MAERTKGNRMTKRSKGMYATRLAPPQAFHACGGEPPAPRTRTATAPLVTVGSSELMASMAAKTTTLEDLYTGGQ